MSLGGDSRADEQTFYEFNGLDDIFDNIDGCPTIDGIEFRFDAYASGSGATYDVKLTWDLGTTYTSAKTSASLGTSDTDTYITVGGSSDTWGRTWDKTELLPDAFGVYIKSNTNYRTYYCDHIQVKVYYTYEVPEPPTGLLVINRVNYCNQSAWSWIKGSGADYTMWRISDVGYPTMTTGTLVYNGTGSNFNLNYDVEGLFYNWEYYICGFSWNTTYCCWGDNEEDWLFATPCNHKINNIYNNTAYTDNGYEYSYSPFNGYTWYLNYTGILPTLNKYQNIVDANGSHESNTANGGHTINVWANYTGSGSSCDLQYFNYSDDNLTINITYWGCNNTNTSDYGINEDNWLFYNGFSFETGELGLFFVFIIFTLAFAINPEDRNIMRPILLFMDVPVSLATGVFYLGYSVFSVSWWIGIFMFLFAVLLGLAGLYYSLMFGRGKK